MRVSVIMGVYNGERYLPDAIKSILDQTLTDFEFIIINDGSTDRSREIVMSFSDPRIKPVDNEKNLGLVATLNRGLELANGKYIARMDADDIALPNRLQRQVDYMEQHPEMVVSGTSVELFNDAEVHSIWKVTVDPRSIAMQLLFVPCFCHPSAILRGEVIRKHQIRYSKDYVHAEDYELWIRLLRSGFNIGNLSEVLLRYRMHGLNIGMTKKSDQLATVAKLHISQFEHYLGRPLREQEKNVFRGSFKPGEPKADRLLINGLIRSMIEKNRESRAFPDEALKPWLVDFFWEKYYSSCTRERFPTGALLAQHYGTWVLLRLYLKDTVKRLLFFKR